MFVPKRTTATRWSVSIVGMAVILVVGGLLWPFSGSGQSPTVLRVGWQAPWATQGQIVQALKHTDALTLSDARAEFVAFSYGGPLNEAALAGRVDVVLTADQPAATLISRAPHWRIVARLMYNRVALYVPPESSIASVADLRGKRVAMPFGAAAQREALNAMRAAGLDPRRDVKSVHLDVYEQGNVVKHGSRKSWGDIDAMAGFDPTPAVLEHRGLARMIHVGHVVSLVLVSSDLLRRDPTAVRNFIKAFVLAYYFYARNQAQADRWFRRDSGLDFEDQVLAIAASIEPNVRATRPEEIDVWLHDRDITRVQRAADFLHEERLIKIPVRVGDWVDLSPLREALSELRTERDLFFAVKPIASR
jgi:ABC-type nitrate/sulfonate/bicarbonate transport system substrate-binding protein